MCTVGEHLDLSLNKNEEIRFKKKHSKLIKKLSKEIPFDVDEIERILIIYYKCQKQTQLQDQGVESMTKIQMRDVLHAAFDLTDPLTINRVTAVLFKSIGPLVKVEEFMKCMALFLKGTYEERVEFCYQCYTFSSLNGFINRYDMFENLKNAFTTLTADDDAEDIARELQCIAVVFNKMRMISETHLPKKDTLRDMFHKTFDITDDTAIKRLFKTCLKYPGPYFTLEEFAHIMSVFLKGKLDDKVKHCFNCYTQFGDGTLTFDMMFWHMKDSVIGSNEDRDDEVKDLLRILQMKLNTNKDGKITFEEYADKVNSNPLLLECLGPCLPSRVAAQAFNYTIFKKKRKF